MFSPIGPVRKELKMRGLVVAILFAFSVSAFGAEAFSVRLDLNASGSETSRNSVELRYSFSSDERNYSFKEIDKRVDSLRQKFMHRERGCFSLGPAELVKDSHGDCNEASFSIKPGITEQDRLYAFAQPVGDGGVLLFTPYLALAAKKNNETEWVLRAPTIIADGRVYFGEMTIRRNSDLSALGYVYLGSAKPERWEGASVIVDPRVPNWFKKRVQGNFTSFQRIVAAGLHEQRPRSTALIVSLDSSYGGDDFFFHGDVSKRDTIRLSFYGRKATEQSSKNFATVDAFLAHELIHLYQPHDDRIDADSWVSEGNADFLSILTLVKAGLLSESQAKERFEQSINECSLLAGNAPWKAVELTTGRAPYACGLTMHLIASLASSGEASGFRIWQLMRTRFQSMNVQAFKEAYPWFAEKLNSDRPLIDIVWDALEERFGKKVQHIGDVPSLSSKVFVPIMSEDCDGSFGFWNTPEGLKIDVQPSCKKLATEHTIKTLAGVEITRSGLEAAQATYQKCKADGKVEVGDTEGRSFTLSCTHPYQPPNFLFELYVGALATLR